jgi:hypothetical protein
MIVRLGLTQTSATGAFGVHDMWQCRPYGASSHFPERSRAAAAAARLVGLEAFLPSANEVRA